MVNARDVVLLGGVLVAYALFSRLLSRTVVSAPMVFVAAGFVLGSEVLDLIEVEVGSSELRLLAEATLALLLFTDASALDTRRLEHELSMPERLLGLALPMTIVAGSVLAWVMFPDLVFFEAAALAVLLAPTDAALGQAVVSDVRLPSVVRQGLDVESGLDDGVCVPLLLAAIAFAEVETAPTFDGEIVVDLVAELGVAVVVGVGGAIALLLRRSVRRDLITSDWAQIVPLVATVATYLVTAELGGSGFIGSFVAGVVYGRLLGEVGHETTELTEDLGELSSAVTFFFFGAVMIGFGISGLSVEVVVYSVLSLTLIRMVPVAVALLGSGARADGRLRRVVRASRSRNDRLRADGRRGVGSARHGPHRRGRDRDGPGERRGARGHGAPADAEVRRLVRVEPGRSHVRDRKRSPCHPHPFAAALAGGRPQAGRDLTAGRPDHDDVGRGEPPGPDPSCG